MMPRSRPRSLARAVAGGLVLVLIACGSGAKPGADAPQDPDASAPDDTPPVGDFRPTDIPDASDDAPVCVQSKAQAKRASRPVDILFVIDNSESMSEEIAEVEAQINTNLAPIVEAAKVDYRIIMLSAHGANAQQKVCIKAPVSGTSCSPVPPAPVETARFFHHSVNVGSNDAWCVVIDAFDKPDQYNLHPTGYGALLRQSAFKVFVAVTDDRVATTCKGLKFDDLGSAAGSAVASSFDTLLTNLYGDQLGTPKDRNYVWHSIVALADFDPADPSKAWPPTAPIETTLCPTGFSPGTGYQGLSKLTGGLRFPTCGLDYTAIFTAIAKSAISGAALACEYQIPPAPTGQILDLATVVPHFTPSGGGAPVDFEQVKDAASCGPDKFYIEDGTIKLCPTTCERVQSDTGDAALTILYGCNPKGTTN